MEFVGTKKGRKRKRRNRVNSKQRRDRLKFEVRLGKHKKFERNIYQRKERVKLIETKMEANAFWENYKAAHEWQHRHNITWWKTRCFALEHENHVLKETIRNLVQNQHSNQFTQPMHNQFTAGTSRTEQKNVVNSEDYSDEDDEDHLEFHLDEDMMNFLAQSIRHKIELKNKKESEEATEIYEITDEKIENVSTLIRKRSEDAKQLYGEASSRVLAMETALQATIERHVDKAKPQYWPNIPLKL